MCSTLGLKDIPSLSPGFNFREEIPKCVSKISQNVSEAEAKREELDFILGLIDHTSLNITDTKYEIEMICEKIKKLETMEAISNVASICVFPRFVEMANTKLKNTGVDIVSVAGLFPHGNGSLETKKRELEGLINAGAMEVDLVIPRGKIIAKKYCEIFEELVILRNLCKGLKLKIIIESGELETLYNVRIASDLAMHAGADFVKTSTGKIKQGASYEAVYVIVRAIKEFYNETGKKVGIKPSGGIRDVQTSRSYIHLIKCVLGEEWLSKNLLRFGASSLTNTVLNNLSEKVKHPELKSYF